MTNDNIVALHTPAQDVLSELLKAGAQQLLGQAIEAEVATLLAQYQELLTESGLQGVVRNGYLPERTVQTGLGDINVKIPKIRDRTGQGIKFNSGLVPPYLKRAKTIEELLPWLYLKGISTGGFKEALAGLLGVDAKGLSSNTISRLKQTWEGEYDQWRKRDLAKRRYAAFFKVVGTLFSIFTLRFPPPHFFPSQGLAQPLGYGPSFGFLQTSGSGFCP